MESSGEASPLRILPQKLEGEKGASYELWELRERENFIYRKYEVQRPRGSSTRTERKPYEAQFISVQSLSHVQLFMTP